MREIKTHKAAANLGLFAQVNFGWQDVGVSKESPRKQRRPRRANSGKNSKIAITLTMIK